MRNFHKALEMSKERPYVRLLACLALCVAPALGATEAYATATTGRPLLEVATELEARYHWRVNYEDPPLENPSELKDLTHPLYRASHPDPSDALLVPLAKPFTFSWEDSGSITDFHATMDRLVNQHNNSGNPGVFQTLYQGSVCHIVPLRFRRKDGTMALTPSVLDVRISFPVQQRSLFQVLSLIFQLVEAQNKAHIWVGMVDPNAAFGQVSTGAENITARDALMLVLHAYDAGEINRGGLPARFTWKLLYGPDMKSYAFNLQIPFNREPLQITGVLSPKRP